MLQFDLVFTGLDKPELVGQSSSLSFPNFNKPMHGHLALTDNYSEMM